MAIRLLRSLFRRISRVRIAARNSSRPSSVPSQGEPLLSLSFVRLGAHFACRSYDGISTEEVTNVVQIALGSPIYFLGVGKVCHITVNIGTILYVGCPLLGKIPSLKSPQSKQKLDEVTSKEEGSTT